MRHVLRAHVRLRIAPPVSCQSTVYLGFRHVYPTHRASLCAIYASQRHGGEKSGRRGPASRFH